MGFPYVMASEFGGKKTPGEHMRGDYKPLPTIVEEMVALGYAGVEHAPFIEGVSLTTRSDSPQSTEIQGEEGGRVTGLHWILSFLNLVEPQHQGLSIFPESAIKLRETIHYYTQILSYCHDLGGTYVVHGSPGSRKLPDGVDLGEGIMRAAHFFNSGVSDRWAEGQVSLVEYAAVQGVRIAWEPLSTAETNFCNTVEEGLRLVDRIAHDHFGLTIDVKAMAAEGRPVAETIAGISEADWGKVFVIHLNDPNLWGPGFGHEDFRPILAAIANKGWNHPITIEPFKPCGGSYLDDCKRILDYLRACERDIRL